MAIVVITASQPSTYARISGAYHTVTDGFNALDCGLARAAEMRRHLPHGFAIVCSALFLFMALITRGEAAFNDHFAHVRGEMKTQAIFTSVMQSMPTMAAPGAKTTLMWLGDTGAGVHCVTNISLAVKGSRRPNSTLIVTANGTTTP
eukprot:3524534-Pleurochrysis_carterae.AAC.1